ncbi:alpha-galactosidase [Agrilactobacillus fermenti]|uniref:alpha-galactosidase n=1 Tax=Agrilactobacillus fermenti TaxID=2586909 RepID=UPI003A5C23A9
MTKAKIKFDPKTKVFYLANDSISYIFSVEEGNLLCHLYFGDKIRDYHNELRYPRLDRAFSPNLPGEPHKTHRDFSKDVLPQEYSGNQTGDFRTPAIVIEAPNGALATDFRYVAYRIIDGKPDLEHLPHSYVKKSDEAKTLIVTLSDGVLQADLELTYTIYADRPVITRNVKIINHGNDTLSIKKIASMQMDMPLEDIQAISLPGAHMRERQIQRQTLPQGVTEFNGRRGTSSHHMNPFIALVRPETTENTGAAVGFQLVYSGNHQFTLDKDFVGQTRILAGINENNFEWQLKPNRSFQTPEVIMAYSSHGLNGMSQAYHSLLRERVARGKFQYAPRPIVLNNWEATYFNFDAHKIQQILDAAQPLGIEMFVLDDGWFGKRDSDDRSLGDWHEYDQKFKDSHGLKGLAEQVHQMGLKFGLWFEPEMISTDSDLYRQHPEYVLHIPGRQMSPSRDQYVLDFSCPEVVDNIFTQMCAVLDQVPIDYIKWDMNRNLTEVYSTVLGPNQQGEVGHRYVLGVYDLADRLTKRYPNILFEGCSGGGGRFDAGILYYFPQSWTSDNTDPVERIGIQYGTTLAYPPSSITAHVSASPNHQNHRLTSLQMRGAVAMSGVLGYELNVNDLSPKEKAIIKQQIQFYKAHRQLLQYGTFYRLASPFKHNESAWEFVSPDKSEFILFVFRILASAQPMISITKAAGLQADANYQEADTGQIFGGDELMHVGLYNLPDQLGDFRAHVKYFKRV